MNPEYQGKTVWVTGSSRGIGRGIARAFADSGCSVALHGRTFTNLRNSGEGNDLRNVAENMSAETGSPVRAFQGNLSDESDVRRCAEEIRSAFGKIDFLVCCAGGVSLHGEIAPGAMPHDGAFDFSPEQTTSMFQINLLPTMLCCRETVPEMISNGFGRIVTIGSIAGCGGHKTGGANHAGYSLAKSAVHQYTRLLAARLRHDGIPVNCIIPGNINTPTTRMRYGGDREHPLDGFSRLEHVGTPEDIARLAVFLCGPGGEYISGQCIRVDGGEQLSPC